MATTLVQMKMAPIQVKTVAGIRVSIGEGRIYGQVQSGRTEEWHPVIVARLKDVKKCLLVILSSECESCMATPPNQEILEECVWQVPHNE